MMGGHPGAKNSFHGTSQQGHYLGEILLCNLIRNFQEEMGMFLHDNNQKSEDALFHNT
jgi:hypothetical protein